MDRFRKEKMILIYFSTFQIAEPIRYLLAYTGTEYEEKFFETGPPPTYDRQEWLEVKAKLDVVNPNVSNDNLFVLSENE